jgi:2,4-dienoyl-CoA reductase-like NADH-dependent reductase (Old Yellow Enzyme family)
VSQLFSPYTLRGVTLRNRVTVAPMCQYSSVDGLPSDWHLVHLGSFARGGAGLVLQEATSVVPEGRITPGDAGIWNDEQVAAYRRITDFIKSQGAVPGVQLAHAGRKASTYAPWIADGSVPAADGGWQTVAPSAVAFPGYDTPRELTVEEIDGLVESFVAGARRALEAGFEVLELHGAHGYLLHQFLSPLSNQRTDEYGGSFENRVRFPLEVVRAVRAAIPDEVPLLLRVSATDWTEGGWDVEQTTAFARLAAEAGVDLVDVSSGGNVLAPIPVGPGYQVPLSRAVREGAKVATGVVGLISEPEQAEQLLVDGAADLVLLARALLRDPHWAQRAAVALRAEVPAPQQYHRAGWR